MGTVIVAVIVAALVLSLIHIFLCHRIRVVYDGGNDAFSEIWIEPVSYTHLDVYTRQSSNDRLRF